MTIISNDRMSKTLVYYAGFIGLGMVAASLGPTLPGLAENSQSALSEVSFLFTARALGGLVGSLLAGRLYDHRPGHHILFNALTLLIISLALVPLLPWLWLLTIVLFVVGIAESGLDVGSNTMLIWIHGDKVGPFMNGLHFFFGLGAFLSPIIIARVMLVSAGVNGAYWVLALLLLPLPLLVSRLPSPAIQKADSSNPAGKPADPLLILLIALFFFMYVGAEVSYGGWIYSYVVELHLASETVAAYLNAAFWGGLTIGRLLSIPLTHRLRPRYLLLADLAGCLGCVGLILLRPASLTAAWIGTVGLGFCMASIFPTTFSLAERRMTITGRITSYFFVGVTLGAMTVPWLIGQLFERYSPQSTMTVIFTTLLLALFLLGGVIWASAGRKPLGR